jgi:PAS domain S-box-containing protein
MKYISSTADPEPHVSAGFRNGLTCISSQADPLQPALRDDLERLDAILRTATEGIITVDERGAIQSVNPAAERIFGYSATELLSQDVAILMPSPYREQHSHFIQRYCRTGEAKIIGSGRMVTGIRKDGTIFPLELSVAEMRLSRGRFFTGFLRDVTKREEAERALRRSEANLAAAQQIAHLGSYQLEVPPDRLHWSDEIFRIVGLDPTKGQLIFEQYINRVIHPHDQERVRSAVRQTITGATRLDLEYRIVRADQSVRYVHSIAEPVLDEHGIVFKLVGTLQDVTDRKELERQILEVGERERRRIGQDLHDSLCQHLAGIEFRLHSLQQKLAGTFKVAAAEAARLAKLVQAGIEQTRALARGLSPVMLPSESLMNALNELAVSTEDNFGISCSFNCLSRVLVSDNAVATHLYRIAQEAVHNAVRHGKSKSIDIILVKAQGQLTLRVEDDGVGMPKTALPHNGMGLRIMQHRASVLGGTLAVQRGPLGGTSIGCSVPLTDIPPPAPATAIPR